MYKILLSVRKDNVKPLFTTYKTEQEVIITPAIVDEETEEIITPTITETQLLDWSCEILADLETKVDELLNTHPITDIIPFKAIEIDAVVNATDGDINGE